ncbi:unnamed protein product [Hermetia illucens]|nr:uncharacterized exonuclease C637.09 isoform X2 [Hermetia illucens]CAD7081931.1 unnamed protein product [Hermetia illucens]
MKTLTAKQEARLQKKKKKMAALAEIIKLNDRDRRNKKTRSSSESSNSSSSSSEAASKGSNHSIRGEQVSRKSGSEQIADNGCMEEPKSKRMKIESIGDFYNSNDDVPSKKSKSSENNRPVDKKDAHKPQAGKVTSEGISQENLQLSESQYIQLKRELNERKRSIRNVPRLRLKEQGEQASLSLEVNSRTPIFLTDIQHLLMAAILGGGSPCTPWRWCHLEKSQRLSHTLVLVVEGLSLFHFLSYENHFSEANRVFQNKLEVIMPPHKEGKIIEELAAVPLTSSEKEELIKRYGSLETAIETNKDPLLLVKTIFPVDGPSDTPVDQTVPSGDTFPRTQLLLSALQMVDEGYPLPLRGKLANRFQSYKFTKDVYSEVTPRSPLFGLDCEMCKTTKGGSELTRISIVGEDMKPVYETLVRPTNKIIDYLTPYSGITPEMMINVTKTLEEVQEDIRRLLPPDAILVGQSLNADLHAMRMMHPYIIDTSIIFNITGERKRKAKLSTLAQQFLGEVIQQSMDGHDPFEDSLASLKLTKLKLSKGLDFGDAVLDGRKKANEVYSTTTQQLKTQVTIGAQTKEVISHNLFAHVAKVERRTAVITSEEMNVDFHKVFNNKAKVYSGDDAIHNENSNTTSNEFCNGKNPPSSIDCFRTEGNKGAIRKTRDVSSNYALTITNLNVAPQRLELSRIEKTISNVDKWISRLWETVAANGLFVVLLGGTPGASSGVAMVKIKKSGTDVATDTPIAV